MDVAFLSHQALLASKICSYAQGMNIIKAKSAEKNWNVNLGGLARIWKVRVNSFNTWPGSYLSYIAMK